MTVLITPTTLLEAVTSARAVSFANDGERRAWLVQTVFGHLSCLPEGKDVPFLELYERCVSMFPAPSVAAEPTTKGRTGAPGVTSLPEATLAALKTLHVDGLPASDIAAELNRLKHPTSRKGRKWAAHSVNRALLVLGLRESRARAVKRGGKKRSRK